MTKKYEEITNRIIKAIESGNVLPWEQSWVNAEGQDGIPLRVNGEEYQGINVLLLTIERMVHGYKSNTWMTFNQANKLGAKIIKGSKSTSICKFTQFKIEEDDNGKKVEKFIPVLKTFNVFNCDQIEGLPAKFDVPEVEEVTTVDDRIESVQEYVGKTQAIVKTGGNQPCYVPSVDHILMPEYSQFKSKEDYAGVLLHELVHWTKPKHRCDREFEGSKRFGGKGYAVEELVAELGSAFLMAKLGVAKQPRPDHSSYIQSWLKALKNDKKFIFTASSKASDAVKYLDKLQLVELKKVA